MFDANGKVVKENELPNQQTVYSLTILERKKSDTPAGKYKRVYEKATKSEDGKSKARSYQGRTIVFERKDSEYWVGVVGKPPLDNKDLNELIEKANEDSPSAIEGDKAITPTKPVAVGDHWTIDPKAIGSLLKNFSLDPKESRAEAKLIKVYTKGKIQFGVLEVNIKLAVKGIDGGPRFDPSAIM